MKYATSLLGLLVLSNSFASRPPALQTAAASASAAVDPVSPGFLLKCMEDHRRSEKDLLNELKAHRKEANAKEVRLRSQAESHGREATALLALLSVVPSIPAKVPLEEGKQLLKQFKVLRQLGVVSCIRSKARKLHEEDSSYTEFKAAVACECMDCMEFQLSSLMSEACKQK